MKSAQARLVTPRFAVITLAALGYFVAFAMLLPTLPRYVSGTLNGSATEVGLVVGSFGISAAFVRPLLGRLGDVYGRRILLVSGSFISGAMALLYPVWESIPILIGLRLITGVGESGAFVGAATAIQDLAPDDRRGEAASYFSLAIYVGLGVGPFLGEWLFSNFDFVAVVQASFAISVLSAALAFAVPAKAPIVDRPSTSGQTRSFLHPAAVIPGLSFTASLLGVVGFSTFIAIYVDDLTNGESNSAFVFAAYAAVVVFLRLFFATAPDRIGARRGTILALGLIAAGLLIIAAWASLIGVYVGALVLAVGVAFNYPALFLFVMSGTEPHERSHSVASFGFFFDIASALGAPLLGIVVDFTNSERPAFVVGALASLIGLIGLRFLGDPNSNPVAESP